MPDRAVTPGGPASAPATPGRPGFVSLLFVLVALAILVGLGLWQLQRLRWKEGVLAHVAALQAAPARPLEDVLGSGQALDFTRVSFSCPGILARPQVRLYSIDGAGQIVYRQMTACPARSPRTADILVDVGFQDCASQTPTAPFTGPLVGIFRRSDPRNFVTPPSQPGSRLWFWRDLPAIAKALGADARLPVYIALERGPQPTSGCKLARTPIPANIPNRHFEYAVTWFGLAASLVGVYVAMLLRRRPH